MNSQCDSTGRVGVCCTALAEVPLPPGQWTLGSRACSECGRRCYLLLVADADAPITDDLRSVVDLLGLAL